MSSNAVDLSAVWTVSFSCLLRCLKFSRRLFFPHIPHIPLAASGARASCSSQWSNRKQEIFLCRQKLSGRKEKVRNDQRWKCVISNKGLRIYLEDIAELSSSYFCGKSHLPRTASDHPSKTGLDNISMRGPKNPKQIKGLAFSRLSLFSACDRRKLHLRLLPLNCVVSNPICGRSYIPALAAILTFFFTLQCPHFGPALTCMAVRSQGGVMVWPHSRKANGILAFLVPVVPLCISD